jgi:hypothetical protein
MIKHDVQGCQVNLLVQPRQPLPAILDFGQAGVGVFPEVIKYRNHGLENIMDRPNFAEMQYS